MGLASGLCLFIEAECAALIRLQVITLSEQVLALDLACAVGAFVSLPIAFLFSHLFLQFPPPPPPFCPTATPTHVPEAGGAGTLARAAWQSFYFVRVWILFSWHSNTYAPPFSPASGRVGTGLVIKYAGYQCQWCQKSTPAAKVARKQEGGREKGRKQAPCVAGTGLVVVCPSPCHPRTLRTFCEHPFLPFCLTSPTLKLDFAVFSCASVRAKLFKDAALTGYVPRSQPVSMPLRVSLLAPPSPPSLPLALLPLWKWCNVLSSVLESSFCLFVASGVFRLPTA